MLVSHRPTDDVFTLAPEKWNFYSAVSMVATTGVAGFAYDWVHNTQYSTGPVS